MRLIEVLARLSCTATAMIVASELILPVASEMSLFAPVRYTNGDTGLPSCAYVVVIWLVSLLLKRFEPLHRS
jgi:hypothetical protein